MVKASGTITLTRVNDGATGNGISSNTPEYYLSTSKTTQVGGSWVTTPPTWVSGKYMWTRLKTTYTNGTVVYSIPFCDTAWEVANGVKGEMITYVNTSVGKITTEVDAISLRVEKDSGTIYKFETGNGNIFDKCQRYLEKDSKILTELTNSDMPLAINLSYLQGKDICISVDIQAINAITKSLRGFVGAEFSIVYMDNTTAKFATYFVPGTFMLEYWTDLGLTSLSKRIYSHYKIEDKPLKSITNLQLTIACNGQKIIASNPKVEIGTYPTGFEFEMQEARDNITTLDKNFSLIDQKVDYLSLQSVSMTEEVTTIKGDVSTVQKRLNSTELKLTPTAITAMVNEKIGADGALQTTKFIMNRDGLSIYDGGIYIYNKSGQKTLYADVNGNIVINKLTAVDGEFSGSVKSSTITGGVISGTTINTDKDLNVGNDIYLGNMTLLGKSIYGKKTSNSYMLMRFSTYELSSAIILENIDEGLGTRINIEKEEMTLSTLKSGGSGLIRLTPLGLSTFKDVAAYGSLTVYGSKARVVHTDNYGYRTFNAVETPTAIFEDNGSGVLNRDGICIIFMNDIVYESTNSRCTYFVQLTKCGVGEVYCDEKKENYFVVKGTPYLNFDWCIKLKQKGYETTNNDEFLTNPINSIDEMEHTLEYEKSGYNKDFENEQSRYYEQYIKKMEAIV